jgi:hypothetical protein
VPQPLRVTDPGPDWVALPWSRSPRWFLPREPPENTRAALSVYHPVTARSRAGWEVARLIAGRGLFRMRRGYGLLPREVWEAAAPLVKHGGTVAVARANHPGRFVGLVIGPKGEPTAFLKVARDSLGAAALRREWQALERFGPLLPPPLFAPRVLDRAEGLLVLEPVKWVARAAPWRMSREVAYALGRFFRINASNQNPSLGLAHGDCAPWNLLRTESGWALIDWENSAEGMPALYDLFHFFVQSSVELRRPTRNAIVDGLNLKGRVGESIEAFAAGSELDPRGCRLQFHEYLRISAARVKPSAPRRALQIRRELSGMLTA